VTQLYEIAQQKTTTAAAGPIFTLTAPSTARPDLRELGIFVSSAPATGPTFGIGRPAANGSGGATGVVGQATDANDPVSTVTMVSSFATTQPTAPTNFFRRISVPPTIGAGVIWTWEPQALNIAASGSFVIWQISALAVTWDVYARWEE
jgi:hypothetical protein